jgi:hypothetical protein
MIIGIDLHGVIDDDPDWFHGYIINLMTECGRWNEPVNTVCIISGPPREDILKELEKLEFHHHAEFDEIYSVVDHLQEKGIEMWQDDNGRWWTHDEDWWKAKAEICEKHNVDVLIDDKKEWGEHFKHIKTKFLLYGG